MNSQQLTFFRDFLDKFWESLFLQHVIDSQTCESLKLWLGRPESEECAEQLYSREDCRCRPPSQTTPQGTARNGWREDFDHIEALFVRKAKRPRKKCFVGHRFIPEVEQTLRWNLSQVLEPYNVELDWSGKDIRSVQILDDIDRRIKAADFCIFDNRSTKGKPNVYIEIGMCYANRTPFIFFDYEPSAGSIPSDLGFALSLRYRNYRQLFRDFYYRLPVFFEKNLRGRYLKMPKPKPLPSVAIVGPGRIGQAMGRLLAQSRVPIAFIAARNPKTARLAVRFIGKGEPTGLADSRLQSASVLLIATSDSAVAQVARDLAKRGKGCDAWQGKVVLHTCGSLPSAALRPLQLRGAAIGALHPYQTVPSPQAGVRNLRGCFWGIEGDRPGYACGARLGKALRRGCIPSAARAENALPPFRVYSLPHRGHPDGASHALARSRREYRVESLALCSGSSWLRPPRTSRTWGRGR